MSSEVDERTSLLHSPEESTDHRKAKKTPLPWRQLSILLIIQISEPLTSQVISPFAPQLMRDVGITNGDEARVGFYVGLLHSLFFATEAATIYHWSRISDRVGRRPVLLTGLFGLSISMYSFGLSKTFWGLVLSRCFNGALNGNLGVMRSMIAEITDSTNIAEAFAYLPFSWSAGTTIGPLIGGTLARPADRFPNVFGNLEFFKQYPYFLPCAVPATISVLCWAITYLYLDETVKTRQPISKFFIRRKKESCSPYSTGATNSPSTSTSELASSDSQSEDGDEPLSLRQIIVPRVILAASSYASVALVDIAFRTVQPVFYATPVELGGLGLDPPTIGTILAVLGMGIGVGQVLLFPRAFYLMGARNLFVFGVLMFVPIIALFPILNALARVQGSSSAFIWTGIALQIILVIFANFAYGVVPMYINASAPNKASIGATNGFAQMFVSIMRAVGPAATSTAYSTSIQHNYLGGYLVYCVMIGMVSGGIAVGVMLPKQVWSR